MVIMFAFAVDDLWYDLCYGGNLLVNGLIYRGAVSSNWELAG